MPAYSCGRDFEVGVGVAPQEWDTGEPVFSVDRLADAGRLLRWQDADGCGEFGAGGFAADGAGGDLDLRVVADALALSGFAVRHEVEFVVVFGKPDGRVHGDATFSKGCEADVALAVDFGGDGSHADSIKCRWIITRECAQITFNFSVAGSGCARGHIQ